jgi:hypothetical protein
LRPSGSVPRMALPAGPHAGPHPNIASRLPWSTRDNGPFPAHVELHIENTSVSPGVVAGKPPWDRREPWIWDANYSPVWS